MNGKPSTFTAYYLIKKNRVQKKRKLYKLALGVSFDLTVSIYLGLFLLFGAFILFDTIKQYQHYFLEIESFISSNIVLLPLLFVIRPLYLSFTKPGILFTSAELKLSMLPFSRQKLWIYCLLEKWLKIVMGTFSLGIIIGLVTPFTFNLIWPLIILTVLMQLLMSIPQWYLYQQPIIKKLLIIFVVMVLTGVTRIGSLAFEPPYLWIAILLVVLLLSNILIFKSCHTHVDWQKVIQTNDLAVWNIWFVNQMSKMQIKPEKRQGWLQQIVKRKKEKLPFDYQDKTIIYKRLWRRSFAEEKEQVIQTIGGILVLLIVLCFQAKWLFGLGICLAIFIFSKMVASFFTAGFSEKLLHSLPWDMEVRIKAFKYWVNWVAIFLGVVLTILLLSSGVNWLWIPMLILLYITVTTFYINRQLRLRQSLLIKENGYQSFWEESLSLLFFGLVLVSIVYPIVSVAFIFLLLYQVRFKK
ncbi:hypothetical protein [Aquibacillus kalidii]|uniref:hypothetical protein n=1 Tax=Aquibacillus kalidii TaxID=2762597 RepID=UPI0016473BBE|nr:hypothetical protein [Aquibacillus kalidii]